MQRILTLLILLVLIPVRAQSPADELFFISSGDIWVWYTDALNARQLTTSGHNSSLILSPDGSRIVYLSVAAEMVEKMNNNENFYHSGGFPYNILVMDTVTHQSETIATQDSYPIFRSTPAWSPDSTELAWHEVVGDNAAISRLVRYNFNTGTTTIINDYINPGFQENGISPQKVQWGQHGISRLYFTYVESGGSQYILELHQLDGTMQYFVLESIPVVVSGKRVMIRNHVWVEHDDRAMIAIIDNSGIWTLFDPLTETRYELPEAPTLIASNANGISLRVQMIPDEHALDDYRWQVTFDNWYTAELQYVSSGLDATPAVSSDGRYVAWNSNGMISYLDDNGTTEMVYSPDTESYGYSSVWSPMRWVTNTNTGTPIPLPGGDITSQPIDSCGWAPRLNVGSFVTVNPPNINNVRSGANDYSPVIATFAPGDFAQITDGPLCVHDVIWWQINNQAFNGWTAEVSFTGDYWLTPLQNSPLLNNCPLAPRLSADRRAVVLGTEANILRDGPDGNGTSVIGQIPAGASFHVYGTGICGTDGRRWYPVNYNGQIGWTAEGEVSTYWLEPVWFNN